MKTIGNKMMMMYLIIILLGGLGILFYQTVYSKFQDFLFSA